MKLLAKSSLLLFSKLASSTTGPPPGYSSKCTDDGFVEITIPYANEATSELLSAVAGDPQTGCTVRGPSSEKHTYNFDSDNNQAVLRLNIDGCGLRAIYDESELRARNEYYMAAANVTIGVHDENNDRDLIFYNAFLGAECGSKTDYTVRFDYAQKIQKHEETECSNHTPDGQCIVAAYENYNFVFREYNNNYESLVEDGAVHMANQMIYLQIEAMDLPATKKFAVKKCDFIDTITNDDGTTSTERYQMFSALEGSCANQYIDLAFGYDFDGSQTDNQMSSQISHRLFLLTRGDQDSYELECDVKVCDKSDLSSDCNEWSACSESTASSYMCEGVTCEADHACEISGTTASCVSNTNGNCESLITHSHTLFSNPRYSPSNNNWYGRPASYAVDNIFHNVNVNDDDFTLSANKVDKFLVDFAGEKVAEFHVYPITRGNYIDRYREMVIKVNDGSVVCSQDYNTAPEECCSVSTLPFKFICSETVVVRNVEIDNGAFYIIFSELQALGC